MNKFQKVLLVITAALLGTSPAISSPLFINIAHQMDMGATHISSPYRTIASADMTRGAPSRAHNLLNLNLANTPDIAAHFLTASYDALSGLLDISGTAFSYDDGVAPSVISDAFSLIATVDNSGNLLGGSFSIGTLLSGTLLDIGYDGGAVSPLDLSSLEFLFEVTSGSFAAAYGGMGALGGMIMTQINFPGDWTNNWTGDLGVVDVAALAVPEPGILLLGGLGLTLIAVSRRRKI